MPLAGSVSVQAGALSVTVPVTPPLPAYTPVGNTSWGSPVGFPVVTQSSFTAMFTIPAPAGGVLFYQIAPGPATLILQGQLSTLQEYLDDLRRLLHDPNDKYWSQADKIAYINKGMQKRDLESSGNRQLLPVTLTVGQDTYTFAATGQAQVFDVIGINLIYGNQRIVLGPMSFTELNATVRQNSPPWQWTPVRYARYGPNQIVFGPAPSLAYQTEWDCCVYSPPLVNLVDVDPLPYPYTTPIPFYAAYWAKINERQGDEAQFFLAEYQRKLTEATNSRVGTTPSMYGAGTWI